VNERVVATGCAGFIGSHLEDPPFPKGAITLEDLEDLEDACRDYDPIESYPLAVNNFRKARGIGSPDEQPAGAIDLCEEQGIGRSSGSGPLRASARHSCRL
jgi:hypothetical protein